MGEVTGVGGCEDVCVGALDVDGVKQKVAVKLFSAGSAARIIQNNAKPNTRNIRNINTTNNSLFIDSTQYSKIVPPLPIQTALRHCLPAYARHTRLSLEFLRCPSILIHAHQ